MSSSAEPLAVPARQAEGPTGDPDDLRARLAGETEAGQGKTLLALVRAQAAAVLGYADADAIEPDQQFLEVGFDSVAAVRLRNNLGAATGLKLPTAVIFERRTPAALAAHLREELGRTATAADPASDGLRQLFVESVRAGRMPDGLAVLSSAARLRATFGSAGDWAHAGPLPVPSRMAEGPAVPRIVAMATPAAMGGAYQYARLAAHFRGTREFAALSMPGFGSDELLPASGAAVVELLAASVREHTGAEPFVLLGYSSGGVLAYAVAAALERAGVAPAAVVLLDTYAVSGGDVAGPDQAERDETLLAQAAMLVDHEDLFGRFDRTKLTAMARYLEILPEIPLPDVQAPTLLLRARDRFRGGPDDANTPGSDSWRTSWSRADEFRTVPGDHFGMVEANTEATAEAVQDWLGTLPTPRSRRKTPSRTGKTRR